MPTPVLTVISLWAYGLQCKNVKDVSEIGQFVFGERNSGYLFASLRNCSLLRYIDSMSGPLTLQHPDSPSTGKLRLFDDE